MEPLLQIKNLNLSFGGIKAVQDVSFDVYQNELLGLIGPNGAGKTTVFNMISGFYKSDSGDILFKSNAKNDRLTQKINDLKPDAVNKVGIARTFQNIRLFGKLSVLDNVQLALQQRLPIKWFDSIFRTKAYLESEQKLKTESLELLKIFNLDIYANEVAASLSYGSQRKLEIVRALATKPQLLILDEPAAGMNQTETDELKKLILFIKKTFNLTILLIEHDMKFVMSCCERIVVLNRGQKIADGTPENIKCNDDVIEAYLGKRTYVINK
jgi:branched-chain amino acid transport system ATP-binding protein